MEEFQTYAWLMHKASECRDLAHKLDAGEERGKLLAKAFDYEEEAHTLADMQKDDLMLF